VRKHCAAGRPAEGPELQVRGFEIAILEAGIDIAGERRAQFGKHLPGEAILRAAEVQRARRDEPRAVFDACTADTDADRRIDAVLRAEVEQRIDHTADDAAVTERVELRVEPLAAVGIERGTRDRRPAQLCIFVSELALDPEHPKIVSEDGVAIEAELAPDAD